MKLQELLLEEKFDAYVKRLKDTLNVTRLGKGAWGQVFQHPKMPNVAVKVFHSDPKYNRFIRWAQKHQNNRFIPKVIDVVDVNSNDGKMSIVFFEKLTPATDTAVKKELNRIRKILGISAIGRQFKNFNAFTPAEWEQMAEQTKDADLAEFAQWMVANVTSRKKPTIDLHNKNVMLRGSQLVFTDPAA